MGGCSRRSVAPRSRTSRSVSPPARTGSSGSCARHAARLVWPMTADRRPSVSTPWPVPIPRPTRAGCGPRSALAGSPARPSSSTTRWRRSGPARSAAGASRSSAEPASTPRASRPTVGPPGWRRSVTSRAIGAVEAISAWRPSGRPCGRATDVGPGRCWRRLVPAHFGRQRPIDVTHDIEYGRMPQGGSASSPRSCSRRPLPGTRSPAGSSIDLADEVVIMAGAIIRRLHLTRLDVEVTLAEWRVPRDRSGVRGPDRRWDPRHRPAPARAGYRARPAPASSSGPALRGLDRHPSPGRSDATLVVMGRGRPTSRQPRPRT